MRLTQEQITQYAATAGFEERNLEIAAAIAMAESGGDPDALGDTEITPGGSLGLWQINLRWHPEYQANPNVLYDPQTNANAAFKVFKSQGFSAWSTYNSGAYIKYMNDAGPQVFLDTD